MEKNWEKSGNLYRYKLPYDDTELTVSLDRGKWKVTMTCKSTGFTLANWWVTVRDALRNAENYSRSAAWLMTVLGKDAIVIPCPRCHKDTLFVFNHQSAALECDECGHVCRLLS